MNGENSHRRNHLNTRRSITQRPVQDASSKEQTNEQTKTQHESHLYKAYTNRWTSLAAATAAKSRQSCPTLCDPTDGSPPGSCPWNSPGKNTGVGCHFLLQCMKVKSGSEVAQSHPTNLRRAEIKRKKEFNPENWEKETSNTIS